MQRQEKSHLFGLMSSTAAIWLLVVALVSGLLAWSAREVDHISREKDRAIVFAVLNDSIERIAHSQESSTIWDEAVNKLLERPADIAWIDDNLGSWFSEYADHDEVYIIDGADHPIYAMRNGKSVAVGQFAGIRKAAAPLISKVHSGKLPIDRHMLSPGASDLALVRGVPVISDSGNIVQAVGTEPIHLSVVYLDQTFAHQWSRNYKLNAARFSRSPETSDGEAHVPITAHDGTVAGYFVWRPFAPGSSVLHMLAPILILAFLISGGALGAISRRLYRKTAELETSRAQSEHLALHDTLTGLPNRAMFEVRLKKVLARTKRSSGIAAILLIDLDDFKQVNDTFGHPAGDALIKEVAKRLAAQLRDYDTVARLGGDEFAIIISESTDELAVGAISERIVADLARPFDLMGSQSFIGASIGVAIAPRDGLEPTELIRKADIALYKAKADGRGRHRFFDHELDEVIRLREETERDIRHALACPEEQLRVFYQPTVSAMDGQIAGVEALLRWQHPVRGLMTPLAFINQAERSGLIEALGEWVLATAVRDAKSWPSLTLSVNVSPVQLRSKTFAERTLQILSEADFEPERLQLEITESVLINNRPEASRALRKLRARGVRIALDDFGTGFSSLSYIRDLAVDGIKIDRSFVTALDSGQGAALVAAIITLGHSSGLQLTAEGVETVAQLRYLEEAGCELLQGFLLAPPTPPEQIPGLLRIFETQSLEWGKLRAAA